jgi:hypothetical protein
MLVSKFAAASVLMSFLFSAVAPASPFDLKTVPADAKWVIHLDMDAARDTRVWGIFKSHLDNDPNFQGTVAQVSTITGMQFPQDLHDVTLFGQSAEEEAGVVIVHAKIDKDKTMNALQMNPAYGSQAFGDYQVITWEDKGKKMFGAFHDEGTVIIGRSAENIEGVLQAMDGKTPSIEAGSVLAAGVKPQLLAYVAAKDLPELKKAGQAQSPIIADLEHAWIGLTEQGDDAVLEANITAKSADAAEQMHSVLNGLKAMVTLAANSDNPDPNPKRLATALTRSKLTTEDQTVKIDWPISLDLIQQFLDQAARHKPAASAPADSTPGQ